MYPASFEYVRATSVAEALALLGEHEDAKLIAGGHSLIPMMKLRLAQPPTVIDIGRIDALRGIEVSGSSVRIGALTTHAELASSEVLQQHCPLIAAAAAEVGDPQVRNRGTIGGNIAHADPGSDLPPALRALGATVHLQDPNGARAVAAADFFVDLLTTAVGEDEVVLAIEAPTLGAGTGSAYLKFEHPASGYAVVGAAAWIQKGADGNCSAAGLAVGGVSSTPISVDVSSLVGQMPSDEAIAAVAAGVQAEDPIGDVYATGAYRLHLGQVYARRALQAARDAV